MTDLLSLSSSPTSTQPQQQQRSTKPHPRIRDEVFWTELEIRRLSNLVAEGIHSGRYVGTTLQATEERQQLHVYIDAMKRKALRILQRAEMHVQSGSMSTWPGIDKMIGDPVSLADEYVRLVENYHAIIYSEEEKVQHEREAVQLEQSTEKEDKIKEDWEVEDEMAFKQATNENENGNENETVNQKRDQLFSGMTAEQTDLDRAVIEENEGIRKRKNDSDKEAHLGSKDTAEMEKLRKEHEPIQDELTSKLADVVGQLKESVTETKRQLDTDSKVVDETEDAVDKNVLALQKQRKNLENFAQSSSTSWWRLLFIALIVIVVFLIVALLIIAPM